ncbi:ABC transporter permease subunit [Parolsenella catena]|uniref:ABC transporter permease subunit n=1 Tax=Parolsenella catena TaxID=2003188 RepID=UPI002FDB7805
MPALGTALGNSVVSALLGTALSVALALAAALTLTRTNVPFRNVWAIVLTLPMLIPSIAHGMGLVYLFGSNGIVTNFLGTSWNIYGLQGIVMGALLYSFPPAFLMLYDALRYENCQVYDAADIMGIPKASQFARITLPYLARPLVSTVFATFTLIITDYGLPIMVGGKYSTLSVLMYQEVIGCLNFDSGVAIGVALILPAILAFVADLLTNVQGNLAFSVRSKRVGKNPGRGLVGWVLLNALALFLVSPLVAFVVKYPITMTPTLANIDRDMVFGMDEYWINSLLIAIAVSVLGAAVSWLAAYVSARTHDKFGRALHIVCITTMAIPGIVLGLSYMLFFKGSPLYGTIGILIMVNLVHFFASPYLMAYNALDKLNGSLEAVGQTLGIPRKRMVLDVFLPQTRGTVVEMASYFFVNCMVTISAVAFLANVSHMPPALLISDFDTQMLVKCAALVSIVIFVVNAIGKVAAALVKRVIAK